MDGLCKQLFLSFYYISGEALEAQQNVFLKIIPLCHLPALSVRVYVILLQQILTEYVYFLCWGLRRASSEIWEE